MNSRATNHLNRLVVWCAPALACAMLLGLAGCAQPSSPLREPAADIVIIGAGISGLSAALEAAQAGRSVLVIDMLSVFGGHAIISTGGLSIVDTPLQRKRGIEDSPDLAFSDFMTWGEGNNEEWVRYCVDHSSEEIYHWLTGMGANFYAVKRFILSRKIMGGIRIDLPARVLDIDDGVIPGSLRDVIGVA